MTIYNVSEDNSILNQFLIELRDENTQKDRWRFRQNLERIGEVLAYEMSKSIRYESTTINTVFGEYKKSEISEKLVFCSILRAGLPMHQGVMRFFDNNDHAFISAYRTHDKETNDFNIEIEYCATPDLNDIILVLVDPMLATGHSLVEVYKSLSKKFKIAKLIILAAISAGPGIEHLKKHCPETTQLWSADIDEHLNDKGYIVPGLGDAGDLAFGSKL